MRSLEVASPPLVQQGTRAGKPRKCTLTQYSAVLSIRVAVIVMIMERQGAARDQTTKENFGGGCDIWSALDNVAPFAPASLPPRLGNAPRADASAAFIF